MGKRAVERLGGAVRDDVMARKQPGGMDSMADVQIDPKKFQAALRYKERDELLTMLDRAIDLLPTEQLRALGKGLLDFKALVPSGLLADVRRFCEESREGAYYEDFKVNSKNFMNLSRGTESWIAECERLFDRCVSESAATEHPDLREALGLLLELLRHVDKCEDDVVFWADEGGSWQVGVAWDRVLPILFRCLAGTAQPDEFAREVVAAIEDFGGHRSRDKLLEAAFKEATAEQRTSLEGFRKKPAR